MKITLTNESITFYSEGVYVQPLLSKGFWFSGSPSDLINILVHYKDMDIDKCVFRVRRSVD